MKPILAKFLPIIDIVIAPFAYAASIIMRFIRFRGVDRMPVCKKVFLHVGVFPIMDHYYEPSFAAAAISSTPTERALPGIEMNMPGQLGLLESFVYSNELNTLPRDRQPDPLTFYMNNGGFENGDAEFWYQIIRAKKPRKIIEIGSGNSTLIAIKAILRNRSENARYSCEHLCIEPYENPWLERTGVQILRKKVEDVPLDLLAALNTDDILFIDSSHIIRPRGDVVFEYLELLPILKSGVIVHAHDIFTPRDYPAWIRKKKIWFWNEQYLLEAFLTQNKEWKIIGALNYLKHNYFDILKSKCPYIFADNEPGSLYIQKTID